MKSLGLPIGKGYLGKMARIERDTGEKFGHYRGYFGLEV